MNLKRRLTPSLAALALAFSASAAAAAPCSFNGPVTVEDEYARSLYVAEVEVIRTGPYRDRLYRDKDGPYAEDERTVRFRLFKAWKGAPGREFTIQDSNTSARFAVDVGERWLIFVGSHGPGRHYVNVCGNSEFLDRLPATLRPALQGLARGSRPKGAASK